MEEPFCHSDRIVLTVNHLRSLGEEGALRTLRDYLRDPRGPDYSIKCMDVVILFHCLFEHKVSVPHDYPVLGGPLPMMRPPRNEGQTYPFFPIVLVDGTPFLLVDGYGNLREATAEETLRGPVSANLKFIDAPWSPYDPIRAANAAEKLIASAFFQNLYDRVELGAELVRQRAKPSLDVRPR